MNDIGRRIAAALVLMASVLVTSSVDATVMVEVPLEEMIQRADVIVHGRVARRDVRVSIEDGMEPQTFTTIEVIEWLGGEGGTTVTLRELGGEVQGTVTEVVGVPRYAVGEEVIVFLERRDDGRRDLRTFAMAQGKFVVRRALQAAPEVERDLDGVAFLRWAEDGSQLGHAGQASMALDAFLTYVRQVRGEATLAPSDAPGTVR